MNDQVPVKPGMFKAPTGNSMKQRLIIVGGGLVVLVIVGVLALNLLSSGSKNNLTQLTELSQEQDEIIRVAGLAATKARGTVAANLSATTAASINTSQQQVVGLLKKNGRKLSEKQLAAKKNDQTDQALSAATQNARFDEVFTTTLTTQLTTYRANIKKAYDGTGTKSEKDILNTAYVNATTILGSQQN